jgi:hypothetical protein
MKCVYVHQPFIAKAPLIIVFAADYQRWFDYYRSSNVKYFAQIIAWNSAAKGCLLASNLMRLPVWK